MTLKKRPKYKKLLQTYARLVIAPPRECCESLAGLNALRLAAAERVIRTMVEKGRPIWALDLAEMAKGAPADFPFKFTHLDAWRIAVDCMHDLGRTGASRSKDRAQIRRETDL